MCVDVVHLCGIRGGEDGSASGFLLVFASSTVSYHSTDAPYSFISIPLPSTLHSLVTASPNKLQRKTILLTIYYVFYAVAMQACISHLNCLHLWQLYSKLCHLKDKSVRQFYKDSFIKKRRHKRREMGEEVGEGTLYVNIKWFQSRATGAFDDLPTSFGS